MPSIGFHPEALTEFAEAISYYLREGSPRVADSFVFAVESAIEQVLKSPDRWHVIDEPDIRRYLIRRFPFVLYYRWESNQDHVTVYAVMHCSREPGYWKHRVG